MRNLIDFLIKYNYWFLFVFLELACVALMFRFNNYQGSVYFTSANIAVAKVNETYGKFVAFFQLGEVNRDLTNRNIMLQRQLAELRDRLYTLERDSSLTEKYVRNSLKGYKMVQAEVLSNSIRSDNNYLVINKGSSDGIQSEMGVVGGGGVVGIVYLTDKHYSLVIPVINVKSKISCRIRGMRYFGYLQWSGGSTLFVYLTEIPRHVRVKVGDYVETSGYSAVFPPGIFVGRVTEKSNSLDGVSYKLKVNLGTDFGNLRDVSVIVNPNKNIIDSLKVQGLETN